MAFYFCQMSDLVGKGEGAHVKTSHKKNERFTKFNQQ